MGKYLVVISVYQNTHRNTVCQAAVYCTYRYWIWNRYEGCGGSNIFYYRKAGFPLFGQRQVENDGNIDWREKINCCIDVLLAVMTSVYLLYTKKLYWSNRYRHLIYFLLCAFLISSEKKLLLRLSSSICRKKRGRLETDKDKRERPRETEKKKREVQGRSFIFIRQIIFTTL